MKNAKFHLGDQLRNDSIAYGKSIEGEMRLEQRPEARIPKCLLQNACVYENPLELPQHHVSKYHYSYMKTLSERDS